MPRGAPDAPRGSGGRAGAAGRAAPARQVLTQPLPLRPSPVPVTLWNQPLFPQPGRQVRQSSPDEDDLLHQAHLQSPRPGPERPPTNSVKLYRYVCAFATAPQKLDPQLRSQKIAFTLSPGSLARVPPTIPPTVLGEGSSRILTDGSMLYRLRYVDLTDVPVDGPAPWFSTKWLSTEWFHRDCKWPDNLMIELNGRDCQPRRRPQEPASLPIDVSHFLVEGLNRVSLAFTAVQSSPNPPTTYIAIETIRTVTHNYILSKIRTRPASDVVAEIKESFESHSDNEDDDLIVVASRRIVSLLDPYSGAKTCKIPVRSITCKHLECFDLETHLQQQRREEPGYPSVVDDWRCPICKTDARPPALFKDAYMMQVHADLKQSEHSGAKAISIEADGSWKPTAEKKPALTEDMSDLPGQAGNNNSGAGRMRKIIEVIEID